MHQHDREPHRPGTAPLITPFEHWCEVCGLRPDDPDAWEVYETRWVFEAV
jgi:hypothetical protein